MNQRWARWISTVVDVSLIGIPVVILGLLGAIGWGWYLRTSHDLVILGGRVIDPESGMDQVQNIAIDDGKISAISDAPLVGRTEIFSKGRIVGPGFIDVESLPVRKYDQEVALRMGVTTALDGVGATCTGDDRVEIDHPNINLAIAVRERRFRFGEGISSKNVGKWINGLTRELDSGNRIIVWAAPTTNLELDSELRPLSELVGRYRAILSVQLPIFSGPGDVQKIRMIAEIAGAASASVLIQQLPLNTHIWTTEALAVLGKDTDWSTIVFSVSPYPALVVTPNMTRYPLDQITAVGGRVVDFDSGEIWHRARRGPRRFPQQIILTLFPMSTLDAAVRHPHALIGSGTNWDRTPVPQSVGTFARVARKWGTDTQSMSWVELFQLMSWKPATTFSDALPGLKNKGVIRVGADADIMVVDPHSIEDWGTYQHPNQPSKGVIHVIVNGKWVLRDGKFFPKTRAGVRLLGTPRPHHHGAVPH